MPVEAPLSTAAVFVETVNVPAPEVASWVTAVVAYEAYAVGVNGRPAREALGAPQLAINGAAVVAGHEEPPKPLAGLVDDPRHDASVTSVHEEAAAAAPVPAGHDVHAVEPATAKVLEPHAMGATVAAGQ